MVFYGKLNGAYINKTIFSRLYCLFSIIAPSLSLPFFPVGEKSFSALLMLVLPMRRSANMRYINIGTEVPWAFALGHENSMLLMTSPAAQVPEWETAQGSPRKSSEDRRTTANLQPSRVWAKKYTFAFVSFREFGVACYCSKSWPIHYPCWLIWKISTIKFES